MSLSRGRRLRWLRGQRAVHGLLGRRGQALLDLRDHLSDDLAGRGPGGVGQQLVELDEQGDEVQVGLDGAQHLRFQQQLAQVEPVDRVALQHLHHRRREVAADVAEPAGHRRRRGPEPAGPAAAAALARPGVVDRGQGGVDARVVAVELHAVDAARAASAPSPPSSAPPSTIRQRRMRSDR